ncbi:MAG: aminopeptidase P family protein [Thermoleophilia bacterium]|nr:aminopeptidase P family protein [Thermoleophilia bacterium]
MAPAVPPEEIERRIRAFQAELAAGGLDAALVVQTTDVFYLSGTAQSAHLVVPARGEPVLCVRKTLSRAVAESPLERIQPLRSLRELPGVLAGAGIRSGRLGLELDVLPAARYLDYGRRFEAFELADCSAAVRRIRSRKSPWELERIRGASELLSHVPGWVAEVLRAGMTELELAAELERLLRRAGHQGLCRMRAFNGDMFYGVVVAGPSGAVPGGTDTPLVGPGPNAAIAKGSSARPIGRGEPVVVDLVGAWDGYLSDQTRTFSLGPLPVHLREAYERTREILHRVAAAARPGVPASHLHALAVELAAPYEGFMGLGDERVSFVGHGLGLEVDEPPYLARGYDEPLEQGMVFALEPKLLFPGEGAVGIENTYLVGAGEAVPLTSAGEELLEL